MEIPEAVVGDRVVVRQRTWVVLDVEAFEQCRVLTLADASSDSSRRARVIHPFDDVVSAKPRSGVRRVSIRTWRHACRSTVLEDGPSWGLRSAIAARIELLPYQLEPTLALLHGLGSRLLIADDVGLGKTVQAMLAIAELRGRGVADRVLVICPAGLREQWVDESVARFNLPLIVMDQQGVRRTRSTTAPNVNPWTVAPLVVVSIDYVKRPEILPSVLEATWDVVVVDEAHGACGQSDRQSAVMQLCRRASYVLLLTATPHNGDEAAFSTLCDMGRHQDEIVVFRRSRSEIGRDSGRRTHTVRVAPSPNERRMQAALASFTRAVRRESVHLERSAWLMLSVLHKRALSSAYALAASAERRLQLLAAPSASGIEQLLLPLDDEAGEHDDADSAPMWGTPALADVDRERRLLEKLVEAARDAMEAESKLQRLDRLLRSIREPAIVFTEYRDTLLHLRRQVAPDAPVVHGGLTHQQRRTALAAFPAAGLLLATDAAGEGLNLQHHCRTVINLELPWNPMRLEQRIGRVDRIGQNRRVHVFHLVADGSERQLLDRLSARVSQASLRVGASSPLEGRRAWTEDTSAHLIVFRDEPRPTDAESNAPAVSLTRMWSEAAQETARIAQMRALTGPSRDRHVDGRTPGSVLFARCRRRRLRAVLRQRTLVIFKAVLMDGTGKPIATSVRGALLRQRADADKPMLESDAREVARTAGRVVWDGSMAAHIAMTRRRIERAQSLLSDVGHSHRESQRGLFDRRAEHEWQREDESRDAAIAAATERVRRAERSLVLHGTDPEPLLILSADLPVSRR
jgi:superfamily II DNA or RNA helicase